MPAPTGLGVWIAFLRSIPGGITSAIVRAKTIGCSWIAPRAGLDGVNDSAFKLEHIAEYKAAGLACYPWIFSKPSTWPGFVVGAKQLLDAGADGIIIDAEQAWDVDVHGSYDAQTFIAALRLKIGEQAFVADAPWPYLGMHGGFPAAEFARGVDARMPQAYATEIGTSVPRCLAEMDREWNAFEQRFAALARPRMPILTTYSKVTGLVVSDVVDALDAYAAAGRVVSLYSLEAMDPRLEGALVARAQRATTQPAPPPGPSAAHPDGASLHSLQIDRQKDLADQAQADDALAEDDTKP